MDQTAVCGTASEASHRSPAGRFTTSLDQSRLNRCNDSELMIAVDFIGHLVEVEIDRPLGSRHPEYGYEYPINYGFVAGQFSGDGEELDAYILGVEKPLKSFRGRCIAVIHRFNDPDDKLIVVPDGTEVPDEEIRRRTSFQEQFFESEILRAENA